jgi:multiple sugar transport system substrate-binding protein
MFDGSLVPRNRQAHTVNLLVVLPLVAWLCAPVSGKPLSPASQPGVPRAVATAAPPSEIQTRAVTVWTHEHVNSREFEVLADAAVKFNRRQRAYRVELLSSLYRNHERWVQGAAINGTLPCLLEFDGPFLHEFVWSGYLQPLDRFASPQLRSDFLPSILAQGSHRGRLYSLGQYESGLALWGNRRYLTAAGVRIPTLDAPWSLTEFEHALQKLQALSGIDYAIDMGAHSASSEFNTYAYSPILQGFGGDLVDRNPGGSAGRVLAGQQSIAAMQHFQHWFKQGWAAAELKGVTLLGTRRAALAWNGNWMYDEYHRALGKDLVLLPLPDLGHGVKTGTGTWTWGISSTCRDPEGAWAFLNFLLSPEEILRMTNTSGTMPSRRSVLARSSLYGTAGPLRLFIRQLDAGMGVPRPATPAYGTISAAFAAATVGIIAGGDAAAELSNAAHRIDEEIIRRHGYPH